MLFGFAQALYINSSQQSSIKDLVHARPPATFLFFFCQSLTSFSFQLSHLPFPLQIFLHLQLFIYPLPPPFMTHSLCIFTHVLLPLLFLLSILLFPLFFFWLFPPLPSSPHSPRPPPASISPQFLMFFSTSSLPLLHSSLCS